MKTIRSHGRLTIAALTVAAAAAALSACAPLAVGGAALTGAMVASDRRSSGAQLDDQGIELRAASRLREQMGSRARISVTSYNRKALLTGEVASQRDKELAETIARQVDNVQGVYNELAIANSPSLTEQAEDSLLTGKVKAALIDNKQISANTFKVVSERGNVYLMGRVTQREADIATQIVRTTKGVARVVRLLEILTEEEAARLAPKDKQ
ncbi:MAG: BON domain-containing protein [Hydrogenophaga sp.]|nr:BON domain-containing protein [Hydrogenophaga sp.]